MAERTWRFQSEDAETVSLHDCRISAVRQTATGLALVFAEGFDVRRDNAQNAAGRHRRTGPAAVYLENGRFLEGAFDRNTTQLVREMDGTRRMVPVAERPVDGETFLHKLDLEVLDARWEPAVRRLTLSCDNRADVGEGTRTFCEIVLACDRVVFCWDDLPGDAWFQDWSAPQK